MMLLRATYLIRNGVSAIAELLSESMPQSNDTSAQNASTELTYGPIQLVLY